MGKQKLQKALIYTRLPQGNEGQKQIAKKLERDNDLFVLPWPQLQGTCLSFIINGTKEGTCRQRTTKESVPPSDTCGARHCHVPKSLASGI
jgi:hypothetical protein